MNIKEKIKNINIKKLLMDLTGLFFLIILLLNVTNISFYIWYIFIIMIYFIERKNVLGKYL